MEASSTDNFDPRFTRMPLHSASVPIPATQVQAMPAERQQQLADAKDMFGGFTFDPPSVLAEAEHAATAAAGAGGSGDAGASAAPAADPPV